MPKSTHTPAVALALAACLLLAAPSHANLSTTEQISEETFAALREVERYQLRVGEKLYADSKFKEAIEEFDKFLTLYPESPGAPYALLMWSHCQRKLRMVNTAIRDGFRSVIDYWPDAPEATLASYMIAICHEDNGEVEKAVPAFREMIDNYPKSTLAVTARLRLIELAATRRDEPARRALLEEMTYGVERTEFSRDHCVAASRQLASILLRTLEVPAAERALATSYDGPSVAFQLDELGRDIVSSLWENPELRDQSRQLAALLISSIESHLPSSPAEEDAKDITRDILYRIASLLGRSGEDEKVFATYSRIAQLTGEDDQLLGRMAESHRHRGRREEARRCYAKFSNAINGQRSIAWMAREDSLWDEAVSAYSDLVDADPNRANEYLWAIAECLQAKADFRGAIQAYRQVDRFPDNYSRMAACYRSLKEFDEAIALYRQIMALKDHAPESLLQIAFTQEQAGRTQIAIRTFQQTCRDHPKSGQASRAHAHLQERYNITITLGGAQSE